MTGDDVATPALREAWNRQEAWSETATKEKTALDRFRLLALILLVAAALLGAAAAWAAHDDRSGAAKGLSGTAAGCLALAGALQGIFVSDARTIAWTTARSAAESLKAEVYRYLMRHPPYVDDDREDRLLDTTQNIEARTASHVRRIDEPTSPAPLPAVRDAESYITERLEDQAGWHRERGAQHATQARHFQVLMVTMSGAGAIVAVVAAIEDTPGILAAIPALSAAAAAVAAHIGASQYDRLSRTYAATTAQLGLELTRFRSPPPSADREIALVEGTERVLALQNENWTALMEPS